MPTLEQIQEQLKRIDGVSHLLGRKEIKELPAILWEDEHVDHMLSGIYNNGLGALFATNRRLLFVDKGLIFGLKVEDFPYDKITSIQYETGIIQGKLTIFASGNRAEITNCDKVLVRGFAEYARARISSLHAGKAVPAPTPDGNDDTISKLERLAKLKEQGILTDEEFMQQKAKILS
jgi:hypothetical protein